MGDYFTPADDQPDNNDEVIEDSKNDNQLAMFEDAYQQEWKGMPDWDHDFPAPFCEIIVRFRNQADFDRFTELMEQNLTLKTKSCWYPKRDFDDRRFGRWSDESHKDVSDEP